MNIAPAEKIANAILYEGYLLYPYRPDSTTRTASAGILVRCFRPQRQRSV